FEAPGKGPVRVAEPNQVEQPLHDRTSRRAVDLVPFVVVPVDIASDVSPAEKLEIIAPREQPDVIDLRYARQEELNRPGEQILRIVCSKRIIERAVDLIEIEIPGGRACRSPAFPAAVDMNLLDERIELVVRDESGTAVTIMRIGADIEDADAVVRIEHGDGVRRTDFDPALQGSRRPIEHGMQHERRQREVVDPVYAARDLDLPLIVGVHLDQDFEAELPCAA